MAEGATPPPRKTAAQKGARPAALAPHERLLDAPEKTPVAAPPELLLDTPIGTARTPHDYDPLVTALGGGVLDFSAMLAIADILPVMTAYVDATLTYRFVNRPLAQWLGRPRKEILGKTVREI